MMATGYYNDDDDGDNRDDRAVVWDIESGLQPATLGQREHSRASCLVAWAVHAVN